MAEETLALARKSTDPDIRDAYLELARRWAQMAEDAEPKGKDGKE